MEQHVPEQPMAWDEVRNAELDVLRASGAEADPQALFGLSFSGGGIRSATFNLGILQALARHDLLHAIDYLSTVSGGGFIGAWLTAWLARERARQTAQLGAGATPAAVNAAAVAAVTARLAGKASIEEIEHLRRFSNYLTPKKSFMSADFWTALTTHFRNMLLNQLMLIPLLLAVCLLAWLLTLHARGIVTHAVAGGGAIPWWLWVPAAIVMFVVAGFVGVNLADADAPRARPEQAASHAGVPDDDDEGASALARWWNRESFVAMLMGATLVVCHWFALMIAIHQRAPEVSTLQDFFDWVVLTAACYTALVALCALGVLGRRRWLAQHPDRPDGTGVKRGFSVALLAFTALFAGAGGGVAFYSISALFGIELLRRQIWMVSGLGTAIVALAVGITVILHLGLMSRAFSEAIREWLARAGAWLAILCVVLIAVYGITFLAPPIFCRSPDWVWGSGGMSWIVATVFGLVSGHGKDSGKPGDDSLREMATRLAPYVFVVGLFGLVAEGLYLFFVSGPAFPGQAGLPPASATQSFTDCLALVSALLDVLPAAHCAWVLAGCLGLVLLMSARVDVNLFSYHGFYRNRIARCYLGASNLAKRKPHPFTGFDESDNPRFADLAGRPYHLVSAALNLTSGNHLAWQERRAASYVFTPRCCGYWFGRGRNLRGGYYRTRDYRARDGGLHVATAVAASGAAASPNMGYHTSPAVAFLLTLFNVRLGWWMPNSNLAAAPGPRGLARWLRGGPRFGVWYILRELFGSTDEESSYVYISDGGHFDNMGLYELVRRRCAFIIVCDGEADGAYNFEGIAGAIAKCRADFDVEIDLDVAKIRPAVPGGRCQAHFVHGTIVYPGRSEPGTLLYLKASLITDEELAADLRHYAYVNGDFPHQSTADQWFDESQFEAYRLLGRSIGEAAFKDTFRG